MKKLINKLKSSIKKVPIVRSHFQTKKELNMLRTNQDQLTQEKLWIEPGHFYSPITNNTNFKKFKSRNTIPGISLNTTTQLSNLSKIAKYYNEQPFVDSENNKTRYYFVNDQFSYSDALTLYGMLRLTKPKRVVEVGSGYSSALMLDVNNLFLGNSMKLTFIEPYPTRLKSLIKPSDKRVVNIIEKPVQKVDIKVFKSLEAGDILFIDSSHVSKAGSDVNWLYFEILPILKKGVIIHVHDIMYPFEYQDDWIKQGRSWNEIYTLKAFMMFNKSYEVIFWPSYLHGFHKEKIQKSIPLSKKNTGGSIWIEKTK